MHPSLHSGQRWNVYSEHCICKSNCSWQIQITIQTKCFNHVILYGLRKVFKNISVIPIRYSNISEKHYKNILLIFLKHFRKMFLKHFLTHSAPGSEALLSLHCPSSGQHLISACAQDRFSKRSSLVLSTCICYRFTFVSQ